MRAVWFAAALALGACSSPAGPLPSGTYHYASNEAGIPVDSIVTISRDATAIVVREDARFVKLPNAPPVSIETRLDPKTFSTNALTIANDPEMENPSDGTLARTGTRNAFHGRFCHGNASRRRAVGRCVDRACGGGTRSSR